MTVPLLRRAMAAALVCSAFAGCASVAPPSAVPDAQRRHGQALPAATSMALRTGTPAREWWRALRDERLDALVQLAMAHNPDRLAALGAVRQARALAGQAEREALPQGGLAARAQAVRPSLAEVDPYGQGQPSPPSQRLATVEQMVSWEVDLFGRIGTASAVAARQADAAEAEAHGAAALLQAEVVRRYTALRQHQHDSERLGEEVRVLEERQALMAHRERAGLADRRDVLGAAAQAAEARATHAAARSAIAAERAALAVLAGRAPGGSDPAWEALLVPAPLPAVPDDTGIVQPADLLARRPDIVKADALLRAALGETVLAERAHLPRISLNLAAGLNATFGTLGQAGALRYAAGPSLQWDWLDAGRQRQRAAAAQAGGDVAWHRFEQTVLQALADSETALRQWDASRAGWQQSLQAEAAARDASAYTIARSQAGLEPPTMALEQAALQLKASRSAMAQQAGALQAFARVQLALAVWQPEAAASHALP